MVFSKRKAKWLFSVFIIYVSIIFVFAVIYSCNFDPIKNNILINPTLIESQKTNVRDSIQNHMTKLEKEIDILNTFLTNINDKVELPTFDEKQYPKEIPFSLGNYKYSFFEDLLLHQGGVLVVHWIRIEDLNSQVIIHQHIQSFPTKISSCKKEVNQIKLNRENLLAQKAEKLKIIKPGSSEIWSFLDFVYFSTITQATVGYGDMLPNSTGIRMIVALQVLIGLALLVILINIVITDQ